MPVDKDIIGDNVRNTWTAATEKPRAAMKAASDAVSNVVDNVKSFLPKSNKPIATWNANAPASPAPKATPSKPTGPMPKYHEGTDYVPKTGPAVLKKGEAVLNNKDAAAHRAEKGKKKMTKVNGMSGAQDALGGKAEPKPKKEISHIVTRKAASGGYIHEHHHTAPEAHPMEQHVTPDQDSMADHMLQNMGAPNTGEGDVPAAGATPPAAPAAGAPPSM